MLNNGKNGFVSSSCLARTVGDGIGFHAWLDKIFQKQVSFSIFFRLWLCFVLLIVIACGLVWHHTQQTLRPSAKRVVEDTLVDTSRLLAEIVATDVANAVHGNAPLAIHLPISPASVLSHTPTWYDQKTHSQLILYITDDTGTVLYDNTGQNVGADFSQWNDVYLSLRGEYGARSSEMNGTSVMYVASPIVHDGKLIGVLSVGKPTQTLTPYIQKSEQEILKIITVIMLLLLITSLLMAWWLRHSIHSVSRYTQGLASAVPPHFYLGRELNELTHNITAMKHSLENKAYVTDYVHTLTHELKSPLTAINASAEILAEPLELDERHTFSTLIKEQSKRLTTLIDKLLTLAKLEQPTFRLTPEALNLDEIIGTCLAQQSALIKQLNKTIIYTPSGITLTADRFWLMSAVQNLVDNAIYYSTQHIIIGAYQDSTHTTIDVVNDCEPLADFVLDRAFERYFSFTSHQDGSIRHKGTGLGLTLVKQIIEHHHGSISLTQTTEYAGRQGNFVVMRVVVPVLIGVH
ncbi:MAG: two-component system sensor histidine kinase CreC [Moraxella sp.]|nr:two-component system sensor histidine kinase CreC [Moraxella sp.]